MLKLSKLVRPSRPAALRAATAHPLRSTTLTTPSILQTCYKALTRSSISSARAFSTSPPAFKGLSPESADPAPKESEPEAYEPTSSSAPADISTEDYHELSDAYLNAVIEKLEQLQEESEEVDVEYSVSTSSILTSHSCNTIASSSGAHPIPFRSFNPRDLDSALMRYFN